MKNKKGFSISRVFPAIAHNSQICEVRKKHFLKNNKHMKKTIKNVYVKVADQAQADRLKEVCLLVLCLKSLEENKKRLNTIIA